MGLKNVAGIIQHAVACDTKVLSHPCSTVPAVIEVSVKPSYWDSTCSWFHIIWVAAAAGTGLGG